MKHPFYRQTWAEIDLNAIRHNMNQIRKVLPNSSKIMAVVKANGYGHGMIQIAQTAIESGASAIAVALLEEALEIRKSGITAPILVLSWVSPKFAQIAAENNITLTIFQKEWLEQLKKVKLPKRLKVHLKWDTGMGRIGIRHEKELEEVLYALKRNPDIYLTGVYTHFATADESDLTYFFEQKKRFYQFLEVFNKLWEEPITIHIGNSAASIRFPEEMHEYIRFGISMYGLYPSNAIYNENRIQLKRAFSLHSRLIHVKKIYKGEFISYGTEYQATADEWIGTIPIGYGDGWTRSLQGASVLVDGKRHSIVGRICMDQTMIRLDKEYKVGEKVTLIGQQKDELIDIEEIARHIGTINYEIPCMINSRIPRVYIN